MIQRHVKEFLDAQEMFQRPGTYVLVDGQYGSTGKGLAADLLEQYDFVIGERVSVVTTNAGPNSGHTAILEDGEKVFTQQIPVFSACRGIRQLKSAFPDEIRAPMTYLNGGAVIDMGYLEQEAISFGVVPCIHSSAAVITDEVIKMFDDSSMAAIASTGKGIGQAMAAKVLRRDVNFKLTPTPNIGIGELSLVQDLRNQTVFVETAQGFSLGVNSGFYPWTTSRECSVPQALADAGISPLDLRRVIMTIRAHPIRVGNTQDGFSGPHYPDQHEMSWEEIGVKAELTSVTKRVRRVFSFSEMQLEQACLVNRPHVILLNFCNYLSSDAAKALAEKVLQIGREFNLRCNLLIGMGPKASNIYTLDDLYNDRIPSELFHEVE